MNMAAEKTGIDVSVDWAWVRDQVLEKERIPRGNRSGQKTGLLSALDECLRVAKHLAKPSIATANKAVIKNTDKFVVLEDGLSIKSSSVSSYMRGAASAHLFVVTIGSDLEETATVLMEGGEQLHGYLLDRIGSFAVESLAAGLEGSLRKSYGRDGLSLSMRLSPGYCDWPVEAQAGLDKAIGFSRAGVTLTESFMMMPRKSISGIVGIGPKELFKKSGSQCGICNKEDCGYRRVTKS